jgi:integrase
MPSKIKYAYLKQQTWLFRRNYPEDVALVLGTKALKQSLKTGDPKLAAARASEVNLRFEQQVEKVRSGLEVALTEVPARAPQSGTATAALGSGWERSSKAAVALLRSSLEADATCFDTVPFPAKALKRHVQTVAALAKEYLRKRGTELRPGGFKSVRYSVGLFASKFGDRPIGSLSREDGRWFVSALGQLSSTLGKSWRSRGFDLDASLQFSQLRQDKITVRTQKRIWSQVNHFLDWAVYEGHTERNPFRTVLLDRRVKASPYSVPTDTEVLELLGARDPVIHDVMLFCLLSGMRAGEAAGLLREDLVRKGNLGLFVLIRPNAVRQLKTEAAERVVPLHSVLEGKLGELPCAGRLFPDLEVPKVTKAFASLRARLGLDRPGLVFHSTRKWFITQCERTGVPEHFTASLVGHKSARSENKLTYGIYSAGISDEQKRAIVDQIRLPQGAVP